MGKQHKIKKHLLIFISFICSITTLYANYADYVQDTLMLIPKPQSVKIQNAIHAFEDTINNNKITIHYVSSIPRAFVNQREAYHLTITPDSILIKATAEQGVYWAKQTLSQLITQYRSKHYLPCCEIVDWPAFHIRGFMHDVGRSYISPDELKQEIAILSTYKINTFHWHITEDLGWRLESKIYPQLNDSANFGRLPG
ncbi:MAG: family 20 glycosylhydrolase, partial [Bacteroidales bacterium]|nr:family 20 glycosylhydrolase [Bacteroidales bacterium]